MTARAVIHRPRAYGSRFYRVSVDGMTIGYVYPDGPAHWCAEDENGDRTRAGSRREAVAILRRRCGL